MESEKVKEIKKALECCYHCIKDGCDDCPYIIHKEDCIEMLAFDMGDYINELETLCNKTYEDLTKEIDRLESENERLVESCKNCHYIKYLEIANGHARELKDRIAELEQENETKTNTIIDLLKKQEFYETEKLKQFSEMLKEKGIVPIQVIDETLKEFVKGE